MFLENRVVKVEEGYLKGVPGGNPGITVFKGVPFAKPPVGDLRWMPPQPAEPWDGVRMADCFPPAAVQMPGRNKGAGIYHKEFKPAEVDEGEDCLYLNIWTPDINADEKLPVMFWIHGGGYSNGYSYEMEFDGEAFCKRGVILVTVPYRLASLGFFAHPELSRRGGEYHSGNYAVLDAIAALKWVNRNIGAFGGDSSNITVFGQSAGAGMVQALCVSPLTRGLFCHAVLQSAGGLSSVGRSASLQQAEQFGMKLLEECGCTLEELSAMDGKTVNKLLTDGAAKLGGGIRFSPVIDGTVLTEDPGAAFAAGRMHDVDYMTGSVAGDGHLFYPVGGADSDSFRALLKKTYGDAAPKWEALFADLIDSDPREAVAQYVQAGASLPRLAWAKAQLMNGLRPIHAYFFDRMMPGDNSGAFHSSELWYVFGTLSRCWRSLEEGFCAGDYALSDLMLDYWTNFAKTGDPNKGRRVPCWPAYTEDSKVLMRFNETLPGAADESEFGLLAPMAQLMAEQLVKK